MSGEKISPVELLRAQKIRQETLMQISRLEAELAGVRERLRRLKEEIPQGVKDSFPKEMAKVADWRSQIQEAPRAHADLDNPGLQRVAQRLEDLLARGREALRLLTEVKEEKREAKAQELFGELELFLSRLQGNRELLELWRPGFAGQLEEELAPLGNWVRAGDFPRAEARLKEVEARFTQVLAEVTDKEARHRQRLYVLEALRQSCGKLGFGELGEPALQDPADRGSPLVYRVDTYDAGTIVFRLTLENIEAASALSTRVCLREFDALSEQLEANFGVKTKFAMRTPPGEEPRLSQRDELDLPVQEQVWEKVHGK